MSFLDPDGDGLDIGDVADMAIIAHVFQHASNSNANGPRCPACGGRLQTQGIRS